MFRPFGVHLEGSSHKRKVVTSVHKCLQGILVGGLCHSSEDVADCEANLPGFWAAVATQLWPGYWNPEVSKSRTPPEKKLLPG